MCDARDERVLGTLEQALRDKGWCKAKVEVIGSKETSAHLVDYPSSSV